MNDTQRPKIAVIGAGWAGLSAAVQLVGRADVTLFEAGKQAGGRARSLENSNGSFSFLDNGQHIMIGAYRGVLTLMERIGVRAEEALVRRPLQWHIHEGLQFQTASLPSPWHIAAGILRADNILLAHKIQLLRDMAALQRHHMRKRPDVPVAKWLRNRRTSRKLLAEFWQPLVWSALNTPLEDAGLNTLCNVLHDGIWVDKTGSDYLLPKRDLGGIVAAPALDYLRKHGASVRLETRVPPLGNLPDGRVDVNSEAFDAAILATAPYHTAMLLPSSTPEYIQMAYDHLRYHSVTTVYLRYAKDVKLPAVLTGLADGTAQWLVNRGALGLPANEIAAVVSVSDRLHLKNSEFAEKIHADVLRVCPDIGDPVAGRIITEKRATAASLAGRTLPDFAWLHHRNIYPAGDYLHPRYPCTLEAAVQSGAVTADLCLNELRASPLNLF